MAGYYDKLGNWVERGPKQTQSSGGGGGGGFMDYAAYQNNLRRLQYNLSRAMNNSSNSDATIFARRELNAYMDKYKDYDWTKGGFGGGGGRQNPPPDPRGGGGGMRNDGGGGSMRRNDGTKRGGGGGFRNDGNPWDRPTPVPESMPGPVTPRALVPNKPPKNAFGGGFAMPQQGFSKGGKVLTNKQLSSYGTKSKWGK